MTESLSAAVNTSIPPSVPPMDISALPPPPQGDYRRERASAVIGVSGVLAMGTSANRKDGAVELVDLCVGEGEVDEREIAFVERSLEDENETVPPAHTTNLHHSPQRSRRVKFKDGEALIAEFDDSNLWAPDPGETAFDMIESYKRECANLRVRPISKLLEQVERLDDLSTPIDTLDLKGVRLDNRSCEVLETILGRMQMNTLDLEKTNLEDEGAIALCEMVQFYGCTSRLILAQNNRLRPRAWLTIGRTLKKSPFISMINVGYCALEEQTLTLLLRSVRANCALQVLKMEGNNLTGKGTFILMAAMKFNENLRELWLASNHLGPEDGQHLGSILRTNHTLRVLDVRDNNLQDAGVRYICAGVAEQQEGLFVLNLSANNISQDGIHHVSASLPCTRTLREINLSHNRCGDNGLFMLKLGLLANRSIEKINLSNCKMTCEGAIALAEVLAESKHITHVDLKENDIRVAGLLALQLAHRMNHTLLFMETPKAYRVEPRDRSLIKSLLTEIDRYCARNLQERENRAEVERRHHHEAQHAQLVGSAEETSEFTAGGREEEEEEKEVDPSLVGSLDDVYQDEPGAMMSEDPFQKVPVDVDDKTSVSLLEMEKKMDAMVVVYSSDGEAQECSSLDTSSLDRGFRGPNPLVVNRPLQSEMDHFQQPDLQPNTRSNEEILPDVVDATPGIQVTRRGQAPDVASSTPQQNLPLDLALDAQQPVDLLDQATNQPMLSDSSQPVDLTDGLLDGSRTEENNT